jgi:hypothetical protein
MATAQFRFDTPQLAVGSFICSIDFFSYNFIRLGLTLANALQTVSRYPREIRRRYAVPKSNAFALIICLNIKYDHRLPSGRAAVYLDLVIGYGFDFGFYNMAIRVKSVVLDSCGQFGFRQGQDTDLFYEQFFTVPQVQDLSEPVYHKIAPVISGHLNMTGVKAG